MLHFPARTLGSYLNLHRWPLEPPEPRTEQSNVSVVGSKDLLFKAVVTQISYFAALPPLAEWAASASLREGGFKDVKFHKFLLGVSF